MVQQSLIEYVNKLIKSGYDTGTIRTTLINAGYSPSDVNRALTYAKKGEKRKISLNLKTILIGVSALILLIIIIFAGIKLLTPKEKIIQIKATPIKTKAYPGDALTFVIELTSEVSRQEQVLLNYEIIKTQTGKIVLTKQDRMTVGEKSSKTTQIGIPEDTGPGKYTLKITMSYKIKTEQKSFSFTVLEKEYETETPEEEIIEAKEIKCPESCDDFNPCTTDYCEKGICRHTPIIPCCGNGVCEEKESVLNCPEDCSKAKETPQNVLSQAKTVAASDPEAAAMLCNKLIRPNDIDLCFSEVAITSKKSVICENVKTLDHRDNCYMSFALEGDYSVCQNVKNSYLAKSCNSLKRSSEILSRTEEKK